MDNDLYNQGIELIGGQEKFNELKNIYENLPEKGSFAIINRVKMFREAAGKAGFNHNQIM